MQKLPLIGGSYSARSVLANAQRCLNLFPEPNRKDSTVPVTHYQRPGLTQLATGAKAGGYIYYAANPANLDTMTLNGVVWTWKNVPVNPTDLQIQASVDLSVFFAITALNASVDPLMSVATYTAPQDGVSQTIVITYDTTGTAGNAYTLAASAATRSGATLAGGANFLTTPAVARCIYQTSDGAGYAVIGQNLYYITTGFELEFVGALSITSTSICYIVDNGTTALVVDGSSVTAGVGGGYTWRLVDRLGYAVMNDAAWTGATRVDFIDTFVVWNQLNTVVNKGTPSNRFGSTLSNQITPLDATYVAAKTSWPDPIQTLIVCKRQILLLGSLKSEVWYDAGNPLFPFAELQGSNIETGIVAAYSVASENDNVYWLSKDKIGQGFVLKHTGNQLLRISNYALEYQIRLMYQNGQTISDAVGYTFQSDGHVFYVLSFPTGNQTWVYDSSVGDPELAWSQRTWTDSNGGQNRDRVVVGANVYGRNLGLDWENGHLYEQSMTTYTDTVGAQSYPIVYLRTFPHLMTGTDPATGQIVTGDGKMIQHDRFQLDATVGTGPVGQQPQFTIRWSDDRGQSWGNPVLLTAGEAGKFGTRSDLRTLGQAMDRVYELSWSFEGEVALNGAWVDGRVLNQ